MAATALIKLTQGPNTDLGGIAVLGTLWDGVVVVTNSDNTDVVAWSIYLRDAPPGSSLSPGLLASALNNTPMATFSVDVAGSYRVELIVTGPGGTTDADIRVFGVPFCAGRGLLAPPYQKLPDPLPLLGSGLPGEKPDELNFGGQTRGWMGGADPACRLLHQLIGEVNGIEAVPDYSLANDEDVLAVSKFEYLEPVAVVAVDTSSAWVVASNAYTAGTSGFYPGAAEFAPFLNTGILGVSTSDDTEVFFDGTFDGTDVWLVGGSMATSDGHIRKLTTGIPPTFSSPYVLDPGSSNLTTAIAYGASYLWVVGAWDVWRVDPSVPGGPYTNVVHSHDYVDVIVDETVAHYGDGNARVWVCSESSGLVQRIELATPGVDATVPIPDGAPRALSVGAGFVWAVGNDTSTSAATLYRIAPDPASLNAQSTSIDASDPGSLVLDVVYDSVCGRLFVYLAQAGSDYPLLLRVHPTTYVVEDSVVVTSSVATLGVPLRLCAAGGYVWVPVANPVVGVPGGLVFRVKATDFADVEQVSNPRDLLWSAGSATLLGDVTGVATATVVERVRGVNVSPAIPLAGQSLWYNGATSRWEPKAPRAHDIGAAEQNVNTTPYAGAATTRVFRVGTSVGAITLNLATPTGAGDNFFVTIIDVDGDADSNAITINPPSGHTISGEATATIARSYGSITLYKSSTSTDWSIV